MKLFKSFTIVSGATFISRITGYLRDTVFAYIFGANNITDAFYLAFTIPNFFRNLLAEGALSTAIIPIYSEELNKKDFKEANKNISNLISFLITLSLIITILGIIFSPELITIIAPGFEKKNISSLAVKLLRIMFPFLFFVSVSAMIMGVLNTLKHFLWPSLAQSFYNLTQIIMIGCFSTYFGKTIEEKIFVAAYAVLIGEFLHILVQLPTLIKKKFNYIFYINIKSEVLKRGLKLLIPAIFGMSIIQLNLIVDSILGSYLEKGSISYLYYSNRLLQFPLALFGISIGTVLLPLASELVAKKEYETLNTKLISSLKIMLLFIIPSISGFWLLGKEIITVLFEHGKFTADDTYKTYCALAVYSAGLISYSAVKIFSSIYYAYQDTKTPVKFAVISLILNIIIKIIIIFLWTKYFSYKEYRFIGLTFGTAFASTFNLFLLAKNLKFKMGKFFRLKFLLSDFLKILLINLIVFIVIFFLKTYIEQLNKYLELCILLGFFASLYFLLLRFFKFDFKIFNI
ncbi:MAG TPA: murein biosynthesis integral membrane protein MurJ [bacterium]|nr:murein biosynthesis integral membrane protein MurJ [bacterium]HOL46868.1 murein biosynthesis integral membrane protein MurJ [bacterium]HPQ18783.1 murein biosynthesis integral membrane protein MurJ [bacterium]